MTHRNRGLVFGLVGEAAVLDGLRARAVNYDPAQAPPSVRVTRVVDETRGRERVWGWRHQTLQGHLEQGRIDFEVLKDLATGAVGFRVAGYARPARLPNPLVRLGFSVFGRWIAQRYYRAPAPDLRPAWAGLTRPTSPTG